MHFATKALTLARDSGIRQADLARAARVSPARITDWKNGQWSPSVEQALRIARVLGVPLDWLADDEQADPPVTVTLTDGERVILRLARRVGIDAAAERLAEMLAETTLPSASESTPGRPTDGKSGRILPGFRKGPGRSGTAGA